MANLSQEFIVTAARRADPICQQLRQEFDIPFLNCWVVVLNGAGETLAGWMGDAAGGGCEDEGTSTFSEDFVKLIRSSLEVQHSREELIRCWQKNPNDTAAWHTMCRCLVMQYAHRQLRQICDQAISDPQLTPQMFVTAAVQKFVSRAHSRDRSDVDDEHQNLLADGERLLVQYADHPSASEVVHVLFSFCHAHRFDVPEKCEQTILRLQQQLSDMPDPKPLEARIEELRRIREEWVEANKRVLQECEDKWTRDFIASLLGDARAAIRAYSKRRYQRHAPYAARLREARAKLKMQRSRG